MQDYRKSVWCEIKEKQLAKVMMIWWWLQTLLLWYLNWNHALIVQMNKKVFLLWMNPDNHFFSYYLTLYHITMPSNFDANVTKLRKRRIVFYMLQNSLEICIDNGNQFLTIIYRIFLHYNIKSFYVILNLQLQWSTCE